MPQYIMTSSNGNIFRITGPLWGEFAGAFHSQRVSNPAFDVFFDVRLNKQLQKRLRAGDLRCHRAHYGVTVMASEAPLTTIQISNICLQTHFISMD